MYYSTGIYVTGRIYVILKSMENLDGPWGRQYVLEEIFEDFDEYQTYLLKALALCQDGEKKRNPTFSKYVPNKLGVEFEKGIKAPQFEFPRYKGMILLQLPDQKLSPRKKAVQREIALKRYAAVVKRVEIATAEEIAMRMRVLEKAKRKASRFQGRVSRNGGNRET